MKKFALLALLTFAGCSAFTPAEVQDAVARLNQDMPKIQQAVKQVSQDPKLNADLAIISSNVKTLDAILNH